MWGILGCLLGFWPLGQNPAGAIDINICCREDILLLLLQSVKKLKENKRIEDRMYIIWKKNLHWEFQLGWYPTTLCKLQLFSQMSFPQHFYTSEFCLIWSKEFCEVTSMGTSDLLQGVLYQNFDSLLYACKKSGYPLLQWG